MQERYLIAAVAALLSLPLALPAAEKKKGGNFAALDTNGDGQLSMAEFTAGMKGKGNEKSVNARFKALDTDKDGVLTQKEYSAGAKKKGEGKRKEK